MRRLTFYLSRQFATDALVLFGVVSFLIWLLQCLRVFDIVSVKGQSLFTLAALGLYAMPPLVLAFAFVCVGVGISRALVSLQASQELHIVHMGHGLPSLFRAAALVCVGGAAVTLFIANFAAPHAVRQLDTLNAAITANLVSSTLQPGRFTQVTEGVVLLIGERGGNGAIGEFFADDRRDPTVRRTYIAERATVAEIEDGYVLRLEDGMVQTREAGERFSEIRFAHYDVNVERFTGPGHRSDGVRHTDSFTLIANAMAAGELSTEARRALIARLGEGLKVFGMGLMVLAISAFPSGSRARLPIPMEIVVLFIAFCELAVSSYGLLGPDLGPIGGSLLMIGIGTPVLVWRARLRRVPPPLEVPA